VGEQAPPTFLFILRELMFGVELLPFDDQKLSEIVTKRLNLVIVLMKYQILLQARNVWQSPACNSSGAIAPAKAKKLLN